MRLVAGLSRLRTLPVAREPWPCPRTRPGRRAIQQVAPQAGGGSSKLWKSAAGRSYDRLRCNETNGGKIMTRAIAVLGASNTGKSTLVDRMCALEGQPQPAAAPGELRICGFTHLGESWQAIDTPGSIEFLHVATDALLAADAAVICVGPDPAAAVLASPYLHAVEAAGTPAVLFINRIDEATGPGPRHRRRAAGLCQPPDHPAPDPDPRRRAGGRLGRPRLRARLGLPRRRAFATRRDAAERRRSRARGARRAARAPVRVRRLPARGTHRGPDPPERRGLCALQAHARREPGDAGAHRLRRRTATASCGS